MVSDAWQGLHMGFPGHVAVWVCRSGGGLLCPYTRQRYVDWNVLSVLAGRGCMGWACDGNVVSGGREMEVLPCVFLVLGEGLTEISVHLSFCT